VPALGNSEYVNENTTGAYEAGFVGDLGVKGLTVHYFQNKNSDFVTASNTVKAEGKNYGIKYNVGQFTVAANKKLHQAESVDITTTTTGVGEITEKAYAVAYAIDKDLSVGILYATAQREANTAGGTVTPINAEGGKQKLKAINIGYNLGPVALAAAYSKNQDAQGVDGADDKQYMLRLIGAF
jgi:predicted porin